jgi:hypothetical protein
MTEHDFDPRVEPMLHDAAPTSFAPGFTERVLGRLAEREMSLATSLERQFVRIIPILAAASLVLGAYNWWSSRSTATSVVEAMLALPQVTVANAYTSDALYGVTLPSTEQP